MKVHARPARVAPLLLLLFAVASTASATTYYVSPSGKDSNSGSKDAPWQTLQRAASSMTAGDAALIADGDYAGGITQSQSGASNAPITFKAVNPGKVIIHGDQTTNTDAFFITFADWVVLDGLTIQNANRAGIRIDQSNSVTIRGCKLLSNAKWGIFTDFSDDLLIENNECAFSAAQHGIYASNSGDRPIIRYNVVHDNYQCGIQINADPALLDPSQGTRGDGITMNAVVQGNIIYNNGVGGGAAINLASVRSSQIYNNLLYNNVAGGIAGWDDGDGVEWGSTNNMVAHNTIYFVPGQGRWCVSFKDGSTGNVIGNNILIGGKRGAIEIDDTSSVISDYNLMQAGPGYGIATNDSTGVQYALSEWQSLGGNDLHSTTASPLFVSASVSPFDFHLQPTSPAIDSGADWPSVAVDLDGIARPQNIKWDMGCYEMPLPAGLPPAAPSNLTADTASASQIDLRWKDHSNNETGFKVEMSTDAVTFTQIAVTDPNAVGYSVTGLAAGTPYAFRVRATNSAGDSEYSNWAFSTTRAGTSAAPAAPTNLAIFVASSSQLTLSWTDNSNNETGFEIERSSDGVSFSQIATVGSGVVSYSDTGLPAYSKYYYRVRAYNAAGDSAYTNIASGRTLAQNCPATPTNLIAVALSQTQVKLTWVDNADNEIGYRIYRSADGVYFNMVDSIPANSTAYTDTGLTANTKYWYIVTAWNGYDYSVSNYASATTPQ